MCRREIGLGFVGSESQEGVNENCLAGVLLEA